MSSQHNRGGFRVRVGVKAGGMSFQHNRGELRVCALA
jgi:hypothetical protein